MWVTAISIYSEWLQDRLEMDDSEAIMYMDYTWSVLYLSKACPSLPFTCPPADKVSTHDAEVIMFNANSHALNSYIAANRSRFPPANRLFDQVATAFFKYVHYNSRAPTSRIWTVTDEYPSVPWYLSLHPEEGGLNGGMKMHNLFANMPPAMHNQAKFMDPYYVKRNTTLHQFRYKGPHNGDTRIFDTAGVRSGSRRTVATPSPSRGHLPGIPDDEGWHDPTRPGRFVPSKVHGGPIVEEVDDDIVVMDAIATANDAKPATSDPPGRTAMLTPRSTTKTAPADFTPAPPDKGKAVARRSTTARDQAGPSGTSTSAVAT